MKEVEAAAERAAAESAAIIERAMGQAEQLRQRAERDNASQARLFWRARLHAARSASSPACFSFCSSSAGVVIMRLCCRSDADTSS